MLRILLATYYLHDWNGSALFTVDLARSLASRGHVVHVHAQYLGAPAQLLKSAGFQVTNRLEDLAHLDLDVAHVHHNVVAVSVREAFPSLPMVMMLHGVLPELEQPPSVDLNIARFLCVSEEVVEHAQKTGILGVEPLVVRNFVNLDHWRTPRQTGPVLRRVLVLTNCYSRELRDTVEKACALAGTRVTHVGGPGNQRADVRPHIARADLVISLGRGAIEAMAMGRNVIVLGSEGGDGFVDEQTFFEFRRCNFSGRTRNRKFTPDALAIEMRRYEPSMGGVLRRLVQSENEESKIVSQLESVYREALAHGSGSVTTTQLQREFSFLYAEVSTLAAIYASESRPVGPIRRFVRSLLR